MESRISEFVDLVGGQATVIGLGIVMAIAIPVFSLHIASAIVRVEVRELSTALMASIVSAVASGAVAAGFAFLASRDPGAEQAPYLFGAALGGACASVMVFKGMYRIGVARAFALYVVWTVLSWTSTLALTAVGYAALGGDVGQLVEQAGALLRG